MQIIYLDVLFLVNFVIDHLLLTLTASLRGHAASTGRVALGAAVGGGLAVVFFFLPHDRLPLRLLCCMATVFCTFGWKGSRRFWGDCGMLGVLTLLFSGGVLLLAQTTAASDGLLPGGIFYFDLSPGVLILGTLVAYVGMGWVGTPGSFRSDRQVRKIECRGADGLCTFLAYVDTGNLLRDPLSGRKVILISPSLAAELTGSLPDAADPLQTCTEGGAGEMRYGLLPFETAGGRSLMLTIRPVGLRIDGRAAEEYIFGVGRQEIEPACGCRALIGN